MSLSKKKKLIQEYQPLKQGSWSHRIFCYFRAKKVASFHDVAYSERSHGSDYRRWKELTRGHFQRYLNLLTKNQFLSRTNFTTPRGRIYCIRGEEHLLWKYCLEYKLIPSTTPLFLKLLKERKCISALELKNEGFDTPDIQFFTQKFSRETKLLKIAKVEGLNVFYREKKDIKKWIKERLTKLQKSVIKEWKRRQEQGKYFEDLIEAFYQLQGFETKKRQWFKTPISQERFEVDVLATKHFFPNSEHTKPIIICVQCKAWKGCRLGKEHILNATGVLLWSGKVKELFPSAIIDFWSYHISDYLFKKSVFINNPSIRLFSTKEISQAFKLVQKLRPKVLRKYKVKKKVKV